MKKKVTVWVLVGLVALLAVTPVMAAGQAAPGDGQKDDLPGQQYFTSVGIVTAVDADTITIRVHDGNRFVKPYAGQAFTVKVDGNTEFRRWTPIGCVPVSFDEVDVDDTASIHGWVTDGVFVASRVTVDVPLDCCTP